MSKMLSDPRFWLIFWRILISTIVLWLTVMVTDAHCQNIGSTATPYDTAGWDQPAEFTPHYGFPVYRLLSNPGGWINLSQREADSLFWALIVYTDSLQMIIRNDTLIFNPNSFGIGQFNSTDTSVTVSAVGISSSDVVIVTPATYSGANVLSVVIGVDCFYVRRAVGGRNNLKFNWIWRRTK